MVTWVANKGNAFQDADGSDDESKVGGNLEREVKRDLCQVSGKVPANANGTRLDTHKCSAWYIRLRSARGLQCVAHDCQSEEHCSTDNGRHSICNPSQFANCKWPSRAARYDGVTHTSADN